MHTSSMKDFQSLRERNNHQDIIPRVRSAYDKVQLAVFQPQPHANIHFHEFSFQNFVVEGKKHRVDFQRHLMDFMNIPRAILCGRLSVT